QSGRLVGGVRRDVPVEQHHIMLVECSPDVVTGPPTVQRVQHRHAVDRFGEVSVRPVQSLPNEIGVHVPAVAGEGHRRDRRTVLAQRRGQRLRQRAFTRTVEALDDHQSPHAPHCGVPARPLRGDTGPLRSVTSENTTFSLPWVFDRVVRHIIAASNEVSSTCHCPDPTPTSSNYVFLGSSARTTTTCWTPRAPSTSPVTVSAASSGPAIVSVVPLPARYCRSPDVPCPALWRAICGTA